MLAFLSTLFFSTVFAQLPFQTASCAWDYCAGQLCSGVSDLGECACYNNSALIYACIADSCGDAYIDPSIVNQVSAFSSCCGIHMHPVRAYYQLPGLLPLDPLRRFRPFFCPTYSPQLLNRLWFHSARFLPARRKLL